MQKSKPLRLVIDTNLWVSFLISDRQKKLDTLLFIEKVQFVFSAELLDEINQTIIKPKLKKYFKKEAMDTMLMSLDTYIDIVEVKSIVKICRDPKDNFLLAFSKDGKADYLLTGDKDLLDLEKYSKFRILTITKSFEEIKHRV